MTDLDAAVNLESPKSRKGCGTRHLGPLSDPIRRRARTKEQEMGNASDGVRELGRTSRDG
ncbi:hypothetical protein MUK42_05799 [Musa troglodytarum]|uniref:Uncharacterized protein n=1 Tax=Musa troglodytarum TaxID=320322 RepID=A0A9E7GD22_9LILI|nr:hypothetical protein MUK42_05799 [Musa troglodytarum]